MAILFNFEAIERLNAQERETLILLADKVQAPIVEEATKESKEVVENYIKRLKAKEEADAARQKALRETFV